MGGGRLYTYLYTVTTRMTPAVKMGSDESHFNVLLIVRPQLLKRKESRTGFEPRSVCSSYGYQPN